MGQSPTLISIKIDGGMNATACLYTFQFKKFIYVDTYVDKKPTTESFLIKKHNPGWFVALDYIFTRYCSASKTCSGRLSDCCILISKQISNF